MIDLDTLDLAPLLGRPKPVYQVEIFNHDGKYPRATVFTHFEPPAPAAFKPDRVKISYIERPAFYQHRAGVDREVRAAHISRALCDASDVPEDIPRRKNNPRDTRANALRTLAVGLPLTVPLLVLPIVMAEHRWVHIVGAWAGEEPGCAVMLRQDTFEWPAKTYVMEPSAARDVFRQVASELLERCYSDASD